MRKVLSVILACVLVFMLTACNSNDSMSAKEITTYITTELNLVDLTTVKGETLSHYFGFNSKDIKAFSLVVSTNEASSDMIAAFEYSNDESKKKIIDGVANYFAKKSSVLKDNVTDEYAKIQNRLLFEYQNIIVLVVCNEAETAKTALKSIGAKELK